MPALWADLGRNIQGQARRVVGEPPKDVLIGPPDGGDDSIQRQPRLVSNLDHPVQASVYLVHLRLPMWQCEHSMNMLRSEAMRLAAAKAA